MGRPTESLTFPVCAASAPPAAVKDAGCVARSTAASGLPGVRDCGHPHVAVVRHELPCGGSLFVATEPAETGGDYHTNASGGSRASSPHFPPTPSKSPLLRRIGSRMTDSDGDVSFGRASESDSVPEELVDWETDSPAFGDTPPFPGNGGTRVMSYAGGDAAAALECAALAAGMGLKHRCYHTGFSGTKLVASVADPTFTASRDAFIASLAAVLNNEEGRLYTGCDLNTSLDDMAALYAASPYVLAGLGACVDPNVATAYGVAGAVASLASALRGGLAECTVFVQGCGKVGGTAARLLAAAGATVLASDLVAGRVAEAVPGATDVSHLPWTDVEADIFCPCAASGVITPLAAAAMRQRAVCGSANVPFTTAGALRAAAARGIVFVPEAVSSAGAVIADSIEFFDPDTFFSLREPAPVYAFIRALCADKCAQLLAVSRARGCLPAEALAAAEEPRGGAPAGARFRHWRRATTRAADFVVVGAGVVGAACASFLAEEGHSVVIVEQGKAANPAGSSSGDSRMYRQMQSDAFYSRMQAAALPMWRDLEAATSTALLSPHGLLFWGEATEETVEGSIPGCGATMRQLGVPHVPLSAAQMAARFPSMAPAPTDCGLFEPGGGAVAGSASVAAFLTRATAAGAVLMEGARVEAATLVRHRHGVRSTELVLSDGTLLRAGRQVIYAAGAWTPQLLRTVAGVSLDVGIHSVAWGHYEVKDSEDGASSSPPLDVPQWFAFRASTHTPSPDLAGCHGLYYGFPPSPAPPGCGASTTRVAKVGVDYTPRGAAHRPASMERFVYEVAPSVGDDMDAFVARHWPGLGRRVGLQCSPYSMTLDGDFVLGPVPGVPGASVFCGGSGRAFKFAPLLGACLADVASGRPPRFNLEGRFDPARLLRKQ